MTIRHVNQSGIFPVDAQQIRFAGSIQHLTALKALAPTGKDDGTCPFANALELVTSLQAVKFDVEAYFIGRANLDRKIFTNSDHLPGNRTEFVFKVAGNHLALKNPTALRRCDPSDFERREDIRYPTPNGHFVISYSKGYPKGSFQSR